MLRETGKMMTEEIALAFISNFIMQNDAVFWNGSVLVQVFSARL